MQYIDNGITFSNVKDLAKWASIGTNDRFSGSDYDYDANDNPVAPKFLINAIDIDWDGAQVQLNGDSSTRTINTTGALLKALMDASTQGEFNRLK